MAGNESKRHIRFEGFSNSLTYVYPGQRPRSRDPREQDRAIHGANILRQLQNIKSSFASLDSVDLPEGIIKDDAIYVEFISEWGFSLKFESLENDTADPLFQILNIVETQREFEGETQFQYRVTLMMTEGGVASFIKKVERYLNSSKDSRGGKPANAALINNIQIIQFATLKSFWTDSPEIPFPNETDDVWWEVWFRRTNNDGEKLNNVFENLRTVGVQIGASELLFAEHRVRLVKGTAQQLSQSLLLLDNLAELRKPQETADFISHKNSNYIEQKEWLDELASRTQASVNENSVLICLLDTGVNNRHPLLFPFIQDDKLYSYKPQDWGVADSWPGAGHGTGVAGLALYGDMVDILASSQQIQILHGLESFKILHSNDPNDPKLYGAITEYAISTPIVDRPNSPRVFCMTVTDKDFAFKGRPSTWSSAIDKIAFGLVLDQIPQQIFIISGGNVEINNHADYPSKNYLESIHDPGQAYNAITVGSYTRKDRIDPASGYIHLAPNGAMAPSNSTSLLWDSQWPNKPDIVMEGGNLSTNGSSTSDHPSMKMLTTDKEFRKFLFTPFGDTSGAAALAAKMAAEIKTDYPEYWPETIRGLMIHSAEWTTPMLNGQSFSSLNERARINLLRSVGYGVPLKEKALYSAKNSLTVIAERTIQPYKIEGSTRKYNEYHLFELPWPSDILRGENMFDQNVTLKITLSYFIEPNPGSRRYANNFQYHSHSLDFAVIKPLEGLDVFKRRISASAALPEDEIDNTGEEWAIKSRVRSKGSIKKDFITMSGAEMAERNKIAIFPKNGWYKTRKKLAKTETIVRYSLILTLETPDVEIDLYGSVFTQIQNNITLNS